MCVELNVLFELTVKKLNRKDYYQIKYFIIICYFSSLKGMFISQYLKMYNFLKLRNDQLKKSNQEKVKSGKTPVIFLYFNQVIDLKIRGTYTIVIS